MESQSNNGEDKKLKKFWEIIECWLLGDLRRIRDLPLENDCGNLNFVFLSSTLAAIELMGFLYTAGQKKDDGAFKEFTKNYLGKIRKEYKDEDMVIFLYRNFRHGLAHRLMPKYNLDFGTAVSRKKPHFHFKKEIKNKTTIVILDADTLFEDFEKALKAYREDIDRDGTLKKAFSLGVEELKKESLIGIEKIKDRLTVFNASGGTNYSTGAEIVNGK